ncbi:MAG: hypothetical protein K2I96_09450, partial [Lachnospiraceae bacterium]|nr:hypothetical protein [Lachnospiraceae bacterium]
MAFQDYLTVEGERMLAKAAAGYKIRFTKLVMGSGEIANGISERDVKAVISPEHAVDIGGVFLNGNDSVLVAAVFTNAEITTGFYFREKAIYISDGVEEVLAIYGNSREQAEYIDTASFTVIEKRIRSIIKLTQSELSNIVLSSAICAVAPIIVDVTMEEYISTAKADIIEVGQVLIANRKVYTYIGDNPHDEECYYGGGGWKDILIDLDDIENAFNEVFCFRYALYYDIIEAVFRQTYTHEPEYIVQDSGLTWEDYGTEITVEEIRHIICAGWDGESLEYYDNCEDMAEEEYYIVFGIFSDDEAMSAAEILEALSTPWNGLSSVDPSALNATEVREAMGTPWNGQASMDQTALNAAEISDV